MKTQFVDGKHQNQNLEITVKLICNALEDPDDLANAIAIHHLYYLMSNRMINDTGLLNNVIDAIDLVRDRVHSGSNGNAKSDLHTNLARVGNMFRWYRELSYSDSYRRIELLEQAINGPNNSMSNIAVDILVDVGSAKAVDSLTTAAYLKKEQGLDEAASRLSYGVKRIGVVHALAKLKPNDQVDYLVGVINDHIGKPGGWGNSEFVISTIQRLALVNSQDKIDAFKSIWLSQNYSPEYRWTAQEILDGMDVEIQRKDRILIER